MEEQKNREIYLKQAGNALLQINQRKGLSFGQQDFFYFPITPRHQEGFVLEAVQFRRMRDETVWRRCPSGLYVQLRRIELKRYVKITTALNNNPITSDQKPY